MEAKRLTDPNFKYVHSSKTDIRKTFKRVRAELAKAKAAAPSKVRAITQKGAAK